MMETKQDEESPDTGEPNTMIKEAIGWLIKKHWYKREDILAEANLAYLIYKDKSPYYDKRTWIISRIKYHCLEYLRRDFTVAIPPHSYSRVVNKPMMEQFDESKYEGLLTTDGIPVERVLREALSEELFKIALMRVQGYTVEEITEEVKESRATIYRKLILIKEALC